jgi:predicted ATP-binding protein involved in virulence
MRIEELHLKNFCSFQELDINFPASNLAVFIGNNGAGKTSILKSITLLLSWLIARIEREKGSGSPIADLDILNGTHSAEITIKLKNTSELFEWSLAKTAKGKKKQFDSKLVDTAKLANIYRTQFTENDNALFPLIIYYPVERSVLNVPLKIRTKHNFSQLDGYDNSSFRGVDFRRFFEWFRDREDIENENKLSQAIQIEELNSKSQDLSSKNDKFIHNLISALTKEKRKEASIEELKLLLNKVISKEIEVLIDDNDKNKLMEEVSILANDAKKNEENLQYLMKKILDIQLESVRHAIKSFMPDFNNVRIQRKPKLRMLVNKNDEKEPLDVLQLSQGEKSLMALVGDIARRLAMMNPTLENPLDGTGIVLIDEIEMHLHPHWQRSVIPNLQKTFLNCQFIITTHSPQVLSSVKKEEIFILEDGALVKNTTHTQGRDSNSILYELFGVEERPKIYRDKINAFYDALEDEKIVEAKEILAELTELFGEQDTEIVRANLHLDFATE